MFLIGSRRMMSKRRILLLIIAGIITFLLFYNAPSGTQYNHNSPQNTDPEIAIKSHDDIEEEEEMQKLTPTPKCKVIRQLNDITDTGYFIFIKPRHADAAAISNMIFYLGLKYRQYFAVNVEKPMNWYGLNSGVLDASYLQMTEATPKIMCQEQSFDYSSISKILPNFKSSKNIIVGFVRDPIQVFMSCLQQKVQFQRRVDSQGTSIMMDKNINNYLDLFEGNTKSSTTYISPSSCNNQLSYSLGLSDITYRTTYKLDYSAQRFADMALERMTDFIIYERTVESLYLLYTKYCWEPAEDLMLANQVPENYVGIGFGNMTPKTKIRLEEFLKFDLEIYNRVLRKFDLQFKLNSRSSWFNESFKFFGKQFTNFHSSCFEQSLSIQLEESKGRKYGLTDSGSRSIQCRMIHASNKVLSNIVYQIQEANLTNDVSKMIKSNEPYSNFVTLIERSLDDERNK